MISLQYAANQARVSGFPVRHTRTVANAGGLTGSQTEAFALIAPVIKSCGIAIVFGGYGCGKTHLATWIATRWYANGYSKPHGKCRYFTMAELLGGEKATFGNNRNTESPLSRARSAGLLVLDEVDGTSDSIFDQREIRQLIDNRYRSSKPTILLTNLPPERIGDALDSSTLDRALEGGGLIHLSGKSLRGRAIDKKTFINT